MPRTPGFHHVALVSGDRSRSQSFYQDILGLDRLAPRNGLGPEADRFGRNDLPTPSILEIIHRSGGARGRPGIGGVHHVAFGVADEPALLMWKRWLNDHGIPTSGPINRGYFRSLYFSDPDGQILELATAGPGYDLDEPIEALGRNLITHHEHLLQQVAEGPPYAERTHPEPIPSLTPAMALSGIHHVSAITSDTERADRFYHGELGLTRIKRTVNQDDLRMPHHFWANYDGHRVAPHSSWTLFEYPARFHHVVAGVGQTERIAFRAESADELDAWRDSLSVAGVAVSPGTDQGESRSISFQDPDGIPLELVFDAQ